MAEMPRVMFCHTNSIRRALGTRALACLSVVLSLISGSARAAIIFQDGFESGALAPAWSASSTNDGRVSVTSDFAPASGSKHLVLDDQADDEVHSISEATLKLDLTYKKNVVLTFAARSLGNEPNNPPTGTFSTTRSYDGVAISVNGGSSWRIVQSLANVGTTYATFSVPLDPIVAALSEATARMCGFASLNSTTLPPRSTGLQSTRSLLPQTTIHNHFSSCLRRSLKGRGRRQVTSSCRLPRLPT